MARQVRRFGAVLPLVVIAAMLGALRCGEPPEGGPDAAHDAGGAPGGQGGAAGAGGATGGAGGIGGAGGSSYDGGVWQPNGDAGWTLVDWAECKALYYAMNPEQAAPPLVWKPCEGDIPGCQRLVVNWSYGFPPLSLPSPFTMGVYKQSGKLRFSFRLNIKGVGNVMAAYSEAMKPVAVWRASSAACKAWRAEWSAKHACIVAGGIPPATVGLLPFDDPNGAPTKTIISAADFPITCNDQLFASLDAANRTFIRDLATNEAHEIAWPNSLVGYPRVHGPVALVQRFAFGPTILEAAEAWLWTKPNQLTKLLDAAPQKIWEARTDGATLAWVQVSATDTGDKPPGELWASPWTTSPAGLAPKKLRNVAPSGNSLEGNAMGGGYFVLIEPRTVTEGPLKDAPDHRMHVYRLTDGRHWEVVRFVDVGPSTIKPASSLTVPGSVLHIDEEEVWWLGVSQYSQDNWTIVRQRLSDLGPGD